MLYAEHLQNSVNKCRAALLNPSEKVEFQTNTLKLLIYNYVLVLLIANQEITWNYQFKDTEFSKRMGHELNEPKTLAKFGFGFRFITVVANTLSLYTVFYPNQAKRNILLPCIFWNFYTITALTESILEITWTMFTLEVQFKVFGPIFMVGVFMLTFHSKLTLKVLRFYDYLNCIAN